MGDSFPLLLDFGLIAKLLMVVMIGVEQGILLAIVLSLVDHTRRGYRPQNSVVVRGATGAWQEQPVATGAQVLPGLIIYRFNHSMYYANAQQLSEEITTLVKRADPPLRWLCIDAAAADDVDYTAAEAIRSMFGLLKEKGVRLVVAQVMSEVAKESRYEFRRLFGEDAFYETLGTWRGTTSIRAARHSRLRKERSEPMNSKEIKAFMKKARKFARLFRHERGDRMLIVRLCFVLSMATLGLGSCTSTQVVQQWSNTGYSSASFKKVMVIGVTKQASIRRSFEDEFVAQLKTAGVSAAPSYLFIPQDGPVGDAVLKRALKEAGADAVIITRLVRVQQKTEIAPGYYPPDPGMAVHPLYTTAWNDYYEPPIVYRSVLYTSETTLYDTTKNQIVWKGTAQTDSRGNFQQEIKDYAKAVIGALKDKKLI